MKVVRIIFVIWGCPLKAENATLFFEAFSLQGVGLSVSAPLVLCSVCNAPVASAGRLLAQQTLCKVQRGSLHCNPSARSIGMFHHFKLSIFF